VVEELVQYVRRERHPAFLEARTPAWPGRAGGENPSLAGIGLTELELAWNPPAEDPVAAWHGADPLLHMVRLVVNEGAASKEEILSMDRVVQERVAKATEAALAAPFPPANDAFADILGGGDLWPK
jgi:hypothetical protein